MPSKSNSQTRWNNAVPEPSTCSAYRTGNGGEIFDSSRRSSCLRSVSRSVRKSCPSQVNKSNAKKHGGFPRRNSRFLNWGFPRLSRQQISPSMTALAFGRQSEIDSASAEKEANGCPLRESSRARPCSTIASALKPSYFNSNNQSGWSNAAPRFSSGIGWNRGNTVATRIAGTHLNQCAVPCFSCRNKDESVGLSEK